MVYSAEFDFKLQIDNLFNDFKLVDFFLSVTSLYNRQPLWSGNRIVHFRGYLQETDNGSRNAVP